MNVLAPKVCERSITSGRRRNECRAAAVSELFKPCAKVRFAGHSLGKGARADDEINQRKQYFESRVSVVYVQHRRYTRLARKSCRRDRSRNIVSVEVKHSA